MVKKFIKQIKCHHEYETISNLYGREKDSIKTLWIEVRSVKKCKHCNKITYSKKLDNNCNVVNYKYRIYK